MLALLFRVFYFTAALYCTSEILMVDHLLSRTFKMMETIRVRYHCSGRGFFALIVFIHWNKIHYFQYFQFYVCYYSKNCIKIRLHQEPYNFTIYANEQWLYLVQIPKQMQKKSKTHQFSIKKHPIAIKRTATHC